MTGLSSGKLFLTRTLINRKKSNFSIQINKNHFQNRKPFNKKLFNPNQPGLFWH